MSVPVFLASSYRYLELAVTDVSDIIVAFRTEAVVNGVPPWTEPSAALFKSPVDGLGRFHDVLLTRIAANNLECRVRDQLANIVTTLRMEIDGTGSTADQTVYGTISLGN